MKSRVIHQLPLLYFFLCNSIRLSTGQVSFLIPWLSCSSCLPASAQYNLRIGKCLKWAGMGRRTSIKYWTSIHALPFSLHLGFSHTVSLSILQISSNRLFKSSFSRHFSRRLVWYKLNHHSQKQTLSILSRTPCCQAFVLPLKYCNIKTLKYSCPGH